MGNFSENGVYLGFDFGFKRIGVAVGQEITQTARPLAPLAADNGVPDWRQLIKLLAQWRPQALVVGLPTCIDDSEQYTTPAARLFAQELATRFAIPVHLVDERLSTKEARSRLYAAGGYRKLIRTSIDSVAAVIILEQWLQDAGKQQK